MPCFSGFSAVCVNLLGVECRSKGGNTPKSLETPELPGDL
jgi:hypothetical protein